MAYVNLDKLVPPNHKITLGGKDYELPGSLRVVDNLKYVEAAQRAEAGDPKAMEQALDALWESIATLNPEADKGHFIGALTSEHLTAIFGLYAPGAKPAPEAGGEAKNASGPQRLAE